MTDDAVSDDEWLYVEADHTRNPLDVVTSARHHREGWSYIGPNFEKRVYTYRTIDIQLGAVKNVNEAEQKAKAGKHRYRLVEGQAREWCRQHYPPVGNGILIFGGSKWRSPDGNAQVACLQAYENEWHDEFRRSDYPFDELCFWVVVEEDPPSR